MKLIKNKLNEQLSLRGAFVILWLATIFSFILTFDFTYTSRVLPTFLIVLFLCNILIGIIAFLIAIFPQLIPKKMAINNQLIPYVPVIAAVYFVFYIAALTTNGYGLIAGISKSSEVVESTITPTPSESPTSIPAYTPTQIPEAKTVYVDPDPIVSCNISSTCGGGTRQMKKSACTQSTCCQLGSTWSVYPSNTACDQAQSNYNSSKTSGANNYPPCTVYYPALGYSQTYSYTSPSQCSAWQQTASARSTNPLPTVAPYQYSQEYIDAMNKANKVLNSQWQPSQFVAPTPRCYATWDEYFNAHPNYAPQNIQGMSATPPCD